MKTTAERIEEDGEVVGYRINGAKQWISNGSIADAHTILARTPDGPTWFVVERGTAGASPPRSPEDKHGIRLSNTAALFLDDVESRRPPDRRGRGQRADPGPAGVRLHPPDGRRLRPRRRVGGPRPGDRVLPRSAIQGGAPLSEKQGFTHKLIVPHAVRLEAARSYIEDTATRSTRPRRERGDEHRGRDRQVMATEAGNAAADAAIQAHGGYGYTREYMVEKIKRDVRHHHDLRGHLGDHGDDDRPRPLAAPPQDPRRLLPRRGRRS
jgi:alkylation response protein AidB-like acyl-CoA dehydrogenase